MLAERFLFFVFSVRVRVRFLNRDPRVPFPAGSLIIPGNSTFYETGVVPLEERYVDTGSFTRDVESHATCQIMEFPHVCFFRMLAPPRPPKLNSISVRMCSSPSCGGRDLDNRGSGSESNAGRDNDRFEPGSGGVDGDGGNGRSNVGGGIGYRLEGRTLTDTVEAVRHLVEKLRV